MEFLEVYLYGYIIAFILCLVCHFKYPYIMTREHTVEDLKVSHLIGYLLISLLSFGTVGIIVSHILWILLEICFVNTEIKF